MTVPFLYLRIPRPLLLLHKVLLPARDRVSKATFVVPFLARVVVRTPLAAGYVAGLLFQKEV